MLKGKIEVARYAYKEADSNVLGYVVRLEDKSGHKITPTLTYCQNDKGEGFQSSHHLNERFKQ